jgi:hypothetical protein
VGVEVTAGLAFRLYPRGDYSHGVKAAEIGETKLAAAQHTENPVQP